MSATRKNAARRKNPLSDDLEEGGFEARVQAAAHRLQAGQTEEEVEADLVLHHGVDGPMAMLIARAARVLLSEWEPRSERDTKPDMRAPKPVPKASQGRVLLGPTDDQVLQAIDSHAGAFVDMMPVDFLRLTTVDEDHVRKVQSEAHSIDKYEKHMAEGKCEIHPFLRIDTKSGQVVGHDGRHRAAAILSADPDAHMRVALIPVPLSKSASMADIPETIKGEYDPGFRIKIRNNVTIVDDNVQQGCASCGKPAKEKKNLFEDTVLRRDKKGQIHLMNHPAKGWASYGIPYASEQDVLDEWNVTIDPWTMDKYGDVAKVRKVRMGNPVERPGDTFYVTRSTTDSSHWDSWTNTNGVARYAGTVKTGMTLADATHLARSLATEDEGNRMAPPGRYTVRRTGGSTSGMTSEEMDTDSRERVVATFPVKLAGRRKGNPVDGVVTEKKPGSVAEIASAPSGAGIVAICKSASNPMVHGILWVRRHRSGHEGRRAYSYSFSATGYRGDERTPIALPEHSGDWKKMIVVVEKWVADHASARMGNPVGKSRVDPVAPTPIAAFRNDETGMETYVHSGQNGTFNVTMRDLDSGEWVPGARVGIKSLDEATRVASTWAGAGARRENPIMTARHIGSCPVCVADGALRRIKVRDNKLVHHGYQRPGFGYIVGDCFAVGMAPHELSPDTASKYLNLVVVPSLAKSRKTADFFGPPNVPEKLLFNVVVDESEPVTYLYGRDARKHDDRPLTFDELRAYTSRNVPPYILSLYKNEPERLARYIEDESKERWERVLKEARRAAQSELQAWTQEHARVSELISTWEPRPLQTVEEEVAAKRATATEREAKKIASMEEKTAALLDKIRARIDSAVKNRNAYALKYIFTESPRGIRNATWSTKRVTWDEALRMIDRDHVWAAFNLIKQDGSYVDNEDVYNVLRPWAEEYGGRPVAPWPTTLGGGKTKKPAWS